MRLFRRGIALLCALSLIVGAAGSPQLAEARDGTAVSERPDLERFFDEAGTDGTMVVHELERNHMTVVGRARSRTRYLPSSTFKIPNSLVALEIGVAEGPDQVFNGPREPFLVNDKPFLPEVCNGDITLEAAFRSSCINVYQDLARQIGLKTYRRFVRKLDYGNRNLRSAPVDWFWLEGQFGISAHEQIAFLKKLQGDDLPFSARTMRDVKRMMVAEETPDYVIHAKTGYVFTTQPAVGWWVGWVETGAATTLFALNLDITAPDHATARKTIAKAILTELGVLPTASS